MDSTIGILVLLCCFTGIFADCGSYEVNNCMKPITDFRTKLGISNDLAYFPIYKLNDKQLHEYCTHGSEVSQCLNELYDCTGTERALFEGLQNSIKFLCQETLKEYQSYQECYGLPEVVRMLEQCDKDASDHIKAVNTDVYGARDRLCNIVKDDFQCNRDAVWSECGQKAAQWQVDYMKKVLNPMLSTVGCNGLPRWVTILIVAAVTGICVIIIILGLYFKRRRNANKGSATQFNNVLAKSSVA